MRDYSANNARLKKRADVAQRAGLCRICKTDPARAERVTCGPCGARSAERAKQHVAKRHALGLCKCGEIPRPGKTQCGRCSRRGALSVAKYTYRLTPEQLFRLKHAIVCELCKRPPKPGKAFCVDHDHKSGAFRGILCKSCNTMLGLGQDSPTLLRAAAGYIERGDDP